MNKLEDLKNRILSKKEQKLSPVEWFMYSHHAFMGTYGYISIEEFKKLPAQFVLDHIDIIIKESEIISNNIPKAPKRRKHGNS